MPFALLLVLLVTGLGSPPMMTGERLGPNRAWGWPVHPALVVRPFLAPPQPWSPGHRGVDLAASAGQPVVSPHDGLVSFVGVIAGRPVLVVSHPGGLRSTLEPVTADWTVGVPVTRGQRIGSVAASAGAWSGSPGGAIPTGPGAVSSEGHCWPDTCVHWGVIRGDTYLDPAALVTGRVVLLPSWP